MTEHSDEPVVTTELRGHMLLMGLNRPAKPVICAWKPERLGRNRRAQGGRRRSGLGG